MKELFALHNTLSPLLILSHPPPCENPSLISLYERETMTVFFLIIVLNNYVCLHLKKVY